MSPIPQALSIGFEGSGPLAQLIVPALILLLLLRQLGVVTMLFNGNTRLPLVAGWDNLLPGWFARLHPRFRTPTPFFASSKRRFTQRSKHFGSLAPLAS